MSHLISKVGSVPEKVNDFDSVMCESYLSCEKCLPLFSSYLHLLIPKKKQMLIVNSKSVFMYNKKRSSIEGDDDE